jgi:hypothetical protein
VGQLTTTRKTLGNHDDGLLQALHLVVQPYRNYAAAVSEIAVRAMNTGSGALMVSALKFGWVDHVRVLSAVLGSLDLT